MNPKIVFISLIAFFMSAGVSTHLVWASPGDELSYPRGDDRISVTMSEEWVLVHGAIPDAERVQAALRLHLPGVHVQELLPLLNDRYALRMTGLKPGHRGLLEAGLKHQSLGHRVWPAYERFGGVGFFDDLLVLKVRSEPDPKVWETRGLINLRRTEAENVWTARAADGHAFGTASRLNGHADLAWIEPDLIRDVKTYAELNDPGISAQWHLASDSGTGSVDAPTAWDTTLGSPEVVIGIFDNGFDMDHPDLVPNLVGGLDAVDDDDDPEAACIASFDGAGPSGRCPNNRPFRASHGTAVAGISAGRGGNKRGIAGVCPHCSLYPVRMLSGGATRSVSTADAFRRTERAGAWVINNSWGPSLTRFFPLSQAEREALDYVTTQGRNGLGVVVVFAAGNDYFTPATANPYASHPQVVTVSASTKLDDFACYSNYGSVISVAAPSKGCNGREPGLVTTDVQGADGYNNQDYSQDFGGTSAASPVVAGVAGLILSVNAQLTAQQVKLILQMTAEKIEANKNNWEQTIGIDLAEAFGYDKYGFSAGFGYGRVNAAFAVQLAIDPPRTGGLCGKDCESCVDGRCAMPCSQNQDCPPSTQCVGLPEGPRACLPRTPALTAPGQPCSTECEFCVDTINSELSGARICSSGCEGDEDCPFGFDCRRLGDDEPRACVPGNKECGAVWGSVRCQGDVFVEGNGEAYCSCECIPGQAGSCPDGFLCSNVSCQRRRGGIQCAGVANPFQANHPPVCLPDPDVELLCSQHSECSRGLFCIDGTCQPDRAPGGCDTCTQCETEDDCTEGADCISTPRGRRCLTPCAGDGDPVCIGDTVCVNAPGPPGFHCLNADYDRKGVCPRAWRCELDGRCFSDDDCDEDVACQDRVCADAVVMTEVDAGSPASEATTMGGESADAAMADPDNPEPLILVGGERKKESGCSAMDPSDSPLVFLLVPLWMMRRRFSRRRT